MFQSARLKLTAWYILIMMTITVLFSIALYKIATDEVQRAIQRQEFFMQMYEQIYATPPPGTPLLTQMQQSEERLSTILFAINGWIFIVAGGAAYFLAGRTLSPIKKMVDEQNRFFSDASHELKTPLTVQRTELEVALRDKHLTLIQAKDILSSNLDEVVNMQSLTANLLKLSNAQSNDQPMHFEKVPLQEVLNEAIKKMNPLVKAKQIEIQKDDTQITLLGNQKSLVDIFVILLDNAIKYTHTGGSITIRISKKDHRAIIAVTDTGIGIAKSELPKIFDRFYRVEKSRSKNETSGYGLGLSIAQKIIKAHNANISVVSQVEKGTTFTMQFTIA